MRRLIVALAIAELCSCAPCAAAQNAVTPTQNRVLGPINDADRVTLKGNIHPLAQKQFDQGTAPGSTPTGRMMLVLERSAAQQHALTQYLSDLQNPVSPAYHKWLTPTQYGAAFAVSDSDLLRVQSWLQAHGFKIEKVPAAHNVIEFSGNFDRVQTAFHTSIDKFSVNGETHFANVSDPQIPAALAPVIAGVGPLNDFHPKPMLVRGPKGRYDPATGRIIPELTVAGTNTSYLFVDPADAAIIYDTPNSVLNPAYSGTTYDGTGVSIGIAGISALTLADVANYRMAFLGEASGSVNLPTVVVDGDDPGLNGSGDEALGDTEVAGGIAPKARIYFYTSAATDLAPGLVNAVFRALDDDTVSILSLSFHTCEAALGTAGNQIFLEAGQQAAAQGITLVNSSSDLGPADCESGTESQATRGFGVNGFASTPYTIAVGGSDFDALSTSFTSYVNNTSRGAPPYYATALKYIPENPWNNSTSVNTTLSNNVANKNSEGAGNIIAGSGGVSSVYAKPAFQTSLTPNDGFRDLPDVSLLAGNGMYRAAWAICSDNVTDGVTTETYTDCQTTNGQFTSNTVVAGGGGTSASAPAFAGMLALVAQAHGSPSDNYRLGQANVILYQLAQSRYSTVFHDITTGNNSVPCASGSPDCGSNLFMTGYNAGTGYDLASGLGSVDAAAMVNNWTSVSLASTSTSLDINGSTAAYTGVHGHALTFDVGVSPATATGLAAIVDNAGEVNGGPQNNGQFSIPISAGAGSAAYNGLPGGSYTVWARFGGDTANASSTSTPPMNVTITPESSTTTLAINAYDSVKEKPIPATNIPYGSYVFADAQITGTAEGSNTQGLATGKVIFADGANALGSAAVSSGNKASWPTIPATGWPVLAATLPVLSGGSHQIFASYSGDPSYNPSSSQPIALSIVPAATSFLIDQPSYSFSSGQAATVLFELDTNWNPGVGPTGTVSLTENNQVLGSTSNFLLSKGNLSENVTGSITIQASQFPVGLNTVTMAYSGDANYASATATITVDNTGPPAFTLSNSGTLQVNAGATTGNTMAISLTPTNDFIGTVNLSCVVNTNLANPTDLPGCTLSPAALNITAKTLVTSTLTVSTTAPTGVALGPGSFRIGGLTALLALLFWFGIPRRRTAWLRMVIAVALPASIGVLGCGSGGGGSANKLAGNSGTTPGSYSVTVTGTDAATGKITAQTTVNLNVNG
jgi:trimeric autotransporter adhesin